MPSSSMSPKPMQAWMLCLLLVSCRPTMTFGRRMRAPWGLLATDSQLSSYVSASTARRTAARFHLVAAAALTAIDVEDGTRRIHDTGGLWTLRGGGISNDEETTTDDETDSDSEDDDDEEDSDGDEDSEVSDTDDDTDVVEDDEEYDDEDDTVAVETPSSSSSSSSSKSMAASRDYVDPLFPSPMMGIYSTIGIMMLSKRIDLFHPTVVKIAR